MPVDRDGRDRRRRRLDRARRRDARITVGPDSAGADPGPACYGRGGEARHGHRRQSRARPHRSRAASPAAASPLDAAAAARALARDVGAPLQLDAPWPAAGVSEIVEENMANAARVHAIERGQAIGRYTMIAFGGGAPLHAARARGEARHRRASWCREAPAWARRSASCARPVAFEVVRAAIGRAAEASSWRA